ncbi:phosphatase 2C-like domain-containing protein [Dunaliella salina]|uniref:Phosphatase 2C-like domain-containing protein n=1 Tax=Dunaliella salina TaxID=3046 RepID=A0ABQ7GEF0_DUNSA|nr:phosphatase 2C-like domain-containing protein [Dunaliella salina]|eukprot:KAF5832962.1 phosphatase 2C-like domain-containing protein [Dunaliella salina]
MYLPRQACLLPLHFLSMQGQARIEAAGGYVWWDRVMGELAVSRAIGDHCFSPYVIPEPEVVCLRRAFSDQLIILATDGMWDVFTNEEAHEAAWGRFQKELRKGRSSQEAAKRTATWLVDKSIDRGSRDNVTVVVVDVRMPNKGSRKGASGAQRRGSEHSYQRGATGDLEEQEEEAAEHAKMHGHFQRASALQGQSEQKTQHTVAGVAQLGDGQSFGRQSGGKAKGGRKQKDGYEGAGKGSAQKQAAGRAGTACGGALEGEQEPNSLSTNSLPRRGFSSAASMNHFSVDEPPSRSGRQQPGSNLKNTSSRLEPVASEAKPPAAPANRCCGCWGSS